MTRLSLQHYRSEELADHLSDLLSLPQAIWRLLTTIVVVAVLMLLVTQWRLGQSTATSLFTQLVWIYSLVAALACGLLLGLLRLFFNAMHRWDGVLEVILRICQQAASDFRSLRAGEKTLPDAGQLATQIEQHVVGPTITKVARRNLGPFGYPLSWFIRLATRRSVRLWRLDGEPVVASQSSGASAPPRPLSPAIAEEIEEALGSADRNETFLTKRIEQFRRRSQMVTGLLKRFILWPLTAVVTTLTILLVIPWIWMLANGH